jgi:hypothetical protein
MAFQQPKRLPTGVFQVSSTKRRIFWDIAPCSPLKVDIASILEALLPISFHVGILFGLFFCPEDEGDISFRNFR